MEDKKSGKNFKQVLVFIFGSLAISYKPPEFIKVIWTFMVKAAKGLWRGFNTFRKKYKALFISILVLIILAPVGYYSFQYYKSRLPQPVQVRFRGNDPTSVRPGSDSAFEQLILDFNDSAVKLELVGKTVSDGISMIPEKNGEWKWENDRRLVFTPADDWSVGQKYALELDKSLFPSHIKLVEYEYEFMTSPFTMSVNSIEFYIDPLNPDLKQVVSTIRFSHSVDPGTFENRISLKTLSSEPDEKWYKDREFKFSVAYNDYFSEAYITSEDLSVPENAVTLQLAVDKGTTSSNGGKPYNQILSRTLTIEGKAEFVKILSINAQNIRNDAYEMEQIFIIETKGKANAEELQKYITVYELPVNKPAVEGSEEIRNFQWTDPMMVGQQELAKSRKISFAPLVSEENYSNISSFRFNAEPGHFIFIRIARGAPFFGGYELAKNIVGTEKLKEFPKELTILHDGALLSMSGEKKLSLLARGVSEVKFSIGRVLPDQINHLVSQTNGDITNLRFRSWNFNQENLAENQYSTIRLNNSSPTEAEYFSFDFSSMLGSGGNGRLQNGLFFFNVNDYDSVNRKTGRLRDSRLVMITDLGILVKSNTDNTRDLFVQSIATGLPVAGAKVQIVGKNGIDLTVLNTDTNGHVKIPSFEGFSREKTPTAYIVSKGRDLSFLPYEGVGRRLDYSGFDTGGVYGVSEPDRINAFLFSDRGIYRPGDSMNIAMIVKSGGWDRSLKNTPLEASITDSRGLEVFRDRVVLDETGLQEISYKTESYSPTGTYQINLYSIKDDRPLDLLGSTTVKVEEFEPDRLKISATFSTLSDRGWISPDNLTGRVGLKNLFGNAAAGNRVEGELILSPASMYFREYRDFRFFDPLKSKNYHQEKLDRQETDFDGNCDFDFRLEKFDSATYNLRFIAEAFEKEGGRSVVTEITQLISPMEYLVGVKEDGDLSYIYKGSARNLQFIAVNKELEQINLDNVNISLKELRWVSVLTKQPNGTYQYRSVEKEIPLYSDVHNISENGFSYSLKTDSPGDFELVLTDSSGVELSRVSYSVLGSQNFAGKLDKNAELQVRLSKEDYAQGEDIEVYIKAPYEGAGLITIERDKVYAYKWFKTNGNSTLQKITVPQELEGNAYINVSFVRSADSNQIYMSPLSYGVAPFSVSRDRRTNSVTLDVQGEMLPGEDLVIKYSTVKKGKIILYAVDEGILQVARYRTPDPLSYFFQKRAMEVGTMQILDLILPEFSLVRDLAAMGGDMGFEDVNANLNPFKRKNKPPAVFWSGILDSDSIERSVSYTVPDYFNGTIRIMAVAVSPDAIGVAEDKTLVRDKYIISPNIPYFAAPGDEFTVSVTVTNNVAGPDETIKLSLKTSEGFSTEDEPYELTIGEGRDKTVSFNIKVNDKPGAAELTFIADGNSYKSSLTESISIRPPIPYRTTLSAGYLDKGKEEIDVTRILYPEYRRQEGSVSFLPLGLADGLVQYLYEYPYLCSEQVVSQAFSSIILAGNKGFNLDKSTARADVDKTVRILMSRQIRSGAFGIWAANEFYSYFQNAYIMHFLTEARERGFDIPESMFNRGLDFLKTIISDDDKDMYTLRNKAYAIYVLTRNEIVTSSYISGLISELENNFDDWEKDVTGLYLASSYKMMQNSREGLSLLKKFNPENSTVVAANNYYNKEIRNAIYLYLRAEHFEEYEKKMPNSMIESFSKSIGDGFYSTTFASYVIMALNAYKEASGLPDAIGITVDEINESKEEIQLALGEEYFPKFEYSDKGRTLRIENSSNRRLYYTVLQSGFERSAPAEAIKESMEIYREYTDAEGNKIDEVKLGQVINVHIKMRAIGRTSIKDIAVVDLLPGGFEPLLDGEGKGNWRPDYADRREDRMVLYGNIDDNISEYIYQIRAVNKGSFSVPPVFGESMYDPNIYSVSTSSTIKVIEE